MSSNTTLDDKAVEVMKNCQFLSTQNEILIRKINEDA